MIILPTYYVFEDMLGLNLYPLLAETTGVSKRTWKNQREGKHNFKPGTFNKVCDNTNTLARENNPYYAVDAREILNEIFQSDHVLGWTTLLDAFNAGNYPDVILPNSQKLIHNFESYSISFLKKYKSEGRIAASQYLLSLNLPACLIGDENVAFIKRSEDIESLSKLLLLISLKSLLYFAASIDAELSYQSKTNSYIESIFSKFLPTVSDQSVLLPIPRFLLWAQSNLGFKNQSDIIAYIDDKVGQDKENAPSVRRQWIRWQNGELIPSWRSLDRITQYLFPEFDKIERWFSVAFVVLFQQIYITFHEMITSSMYTGTEMDILDEFHHYDNSVSDLSNIYHFNSLKGRLPN